MRTKRACACMSMTDISRNHAFSAFGPDILARLCQSCIDNASEVNCKASYSVGLSPIGFSAARLELAVPVSDFSNLELPSTLHGRRLCFALRFT